MMEQTCNLILLNGGLDEHGASLIESDLVKPDPIEIWPGQILLAISRRDQIGLISY